MLNRSIKLRAGMAVCALMMLNVPAAAAAAAAAAEFDRGQALYESHCGECHKSWAHTRVQRKVENVSELRERVVAWSAHTGQVWSAEDIDDVVQYLNRRFYQFTEQP
jgi:mono/diheme cytochrome c family protein